jgi:hypothetical protein
MLCTDEYDGSGPNSVLLSDSFGVLQYSSMIVCAVRGALEWLVDDVDDDVVDDVVDDV